VVSSAAAGRLLGLATIEPGAGQVMTQLLSRGQGIELTERPAQAAEFGRPARDACAGVVAVLRDGSVLALDDPQAGTVQTGDRLVVVGASSAGQR
jgi:voltage-gated potassium channel